MTGDRLRELGALRRAATEGPWEVAAKNGKPSNYVQSPAVTVADVRYRNGTADAAYIAAAGSVTADEWDRLAEVVAAAREWAASEDIVRTNPAPTRAEWDRCLAARHQLGTVVAALDKGGTDD